MKFSTNDKVICISCNPYSDFISVGSIYKVVTSFKLHEKWFIKIDENDLQEKNIIFYQSRFAKIVEIK